MLVDPEKSVWELKPHSGGFLLMLRAHGWARCHGRDVQVYEGSGYLAVAGELLVYRLRERITGHSFWVVVRQH